MRNVDRRPLQQLLRRRLSGERQCAHAVHDQVHPEQLDRLQRRSNAQHRSKECNCKCSDVDGELELEELPDVVKDAAAPHDRLDDGVEVVVCDDDVRRLLGNVRACNTHSQADVGVAERRRVVGAVARDGDELLLALAQQAHEAELVVGLGAGQHLEVVEDRVELLVRHLAEDAALQHGAVGEDAALPRDGHRCVLVVAGDHAHDDARILAELHGVGHLRPQRVLDARQAEEGELLLGLLVLLVGHVVRSVEDVEVAVGDHNVAQRLVGHVADQRRELIALAAVERGHAAIAVHDVRAALQHNLGGALGEHAELAVGQLHHRAHALAVGRERDHLDHRRLDLAASLDVVNAERLNEEQQRALGGAAVELRDAGLLGVVRDRRRLAQVAADALDNEVLHLAAQATDWHRVEHAAGVALHDAHLVHRQRARLVGADRRAAAHRLARAEAADEVLVLHHLLHRVGQRNRHGEGKALWHGDDNDRHGDDEVVEDLDEGEELESKANPVDHPVDHQHDEHHDGDSEADVSNVTRQDAELDLQGRLLALDVRHARQQLSVGRLHSDGDGHHGAAALGDRAAGEHEGNLCCLVDINALAGHRRLVRGERKTAHVHTVGRKGFSRAYVHQISHHHVVNRNLRLLSLPNHRHLPVLLLLV
mmetsp:Transcript_16662/g.65070  ORF Transcript_16662/g.65070 Transcript_16662/m.65070 type:complete len:651 (-) Transcript_16662:567-2519(-)